MKVIIVEDEKPAVEKLKKMITDYNSGNQIIDSFCSVSETVNFLNNTDNLPDLIFMDIQLTDGLSFDIIEQTNVKTPIIFVTAYNEYAIRAFKTNSIDYLVKPFSYVDFCQSMEKIETLKKNLFIDSKKMDFEKFGNALSKLNKLFKTRFMIKVGEHIKSVKAANISLFFAEGRTVYLLTNKQNKYIVDFKLEELETSLDPTMFFRVNRTFIVNINTIKDVIVYSNSRLKITPNNNFDKDIIVSRDKVNSLKTWLDGMF
ncbi:MAG: response regulator transcription factor [Bacteroidetes bacterium]|nr:response regulator transcription factor [Bacteroidota bacterium]